MFINDIHIFWYVGIGLLGLLVGRILDLVNKNLAAHKTILSIDTLKNYLKNTPANYKLMLVVSVIYIALLRVIGFEDKLQIISFIIIIPMLIVAFCIDFKHQIIPNRLTLTMLEVGLIFSFIRGINNIYVAFEMWLGMIVGAGIFLILTIVGNLIFRKETMGFGDVKLMGALGLLFGWRCIIAISILSFFIAAIYSVILIIKNKIKKQDIEEFIPFGPFIVVASFIIMFVPLDVLIKIIFWVFTLGKIKW